MTLIIGIIIGSIATMLILPPTLSGTVQRLARRKIRQLVASRKGGEQS